MVTVYWSENRPTPTLQFNSRAAVALCHDDEHHTVEIAVLVSRQNPRRLAFEPRAGGLKMTKQRVVSGGSLAAMVRRADCPIRLVLTADPEHPGRFLAELPASTEAAGARFLNTLDTHHPGGVPAIPQTPAPQPIVPVAVEGTYDPAPVDLEHPPGAGVYNRGVPGPLPVSDVLETIIQANSMQPPDLNPAPSPEDLMADIDALNGNGDDDGTDDDEEDE